MDALEAAVAETSEKLGLEDYKVSIYLSILYPVTEVNEFGIVDGRNLDFSIFPAMFTKCSQFSHTKFILTDYDKDVLKKKGLVVKYSIHTLPFLREPFPLALFSFFLRKTISCIKLKILSDFRKEVLS
jgi:hypothetical protein